MSQFICNRYFILFWLHFSQMVRQTTPGTATDKSVAFGEKAYKCNFEDCGRLYTTSHHLKVTRAM